MRDESSSSENLYRKKWHKLIDLNETIIRYVFEELRIKAEIVKSSDFRPEGTNRLANFDVQKIGA